MFDSIDKFPSVEEMEKSLGFCPFCKKACLLENTYNKKIYHFVCKDNAHHYESRARAYKYSRKTFYRLAKERLDVSSLQIFISRDYEHVSRAGLKYVYKPRVQICSKNVRDPHAAVIRKFTPARFKKLFRPENPEHFMKKLETISKAAVLMK